MSPVTTFTMQQGIALRAPWPGAVLLLHCDGLNRPYADHRLYAHLLCRLLIAQCPGLDRQAVSPRGGAITTPLDDAGSAILGYVECSQIVDNREGDSQLPWARAGGSFIRFVEPRVFLEPVPFPSAAPGSSPAPGPLLVRSDLPGLAEAMAAALTTEQWHSVEWDRRHHEMMSRASAEKPGKPDYGLRNMLPGKLARANQKRREM